MLDGQKYQLLYILYFWERVGLYKFMLVHIQWFYLHKANRCQTNRGSFNHVRGFNAKIWPHFNEIVVFVFTENVPIFDSNIAVYHFDTCGLSIFLQSHFLYNILSLNNILYF